MLCHSLQCRPVGRRLRRVVRPICNQSQGPIRPIPYGKGKIEQQPATDGDHRRALWKGTLTQEVAACHGGVFDKIRFHPTFEVVQGGKKIIATTVIGSDRAAG